MVKNDDRHCGPILVTGSNRSGSTFVGKALALANKTAYMHEPFNPLLPGILQRHVNFWYQYVDASSPAPLRRAIACTAEMRPPLSRIYSEARTPRDRARALRDHIQLTSCRARGARPLLKDPTAFFAAEYLAETHGAEVTVLVRHPAAFVGSLKRLGWRLDFRDLLQQDGLMERYLNAFASEIERAATAELDLVGHSVLTWRIFAAVAADWRSSRPDFSVLRYEDVARDPLPAMRELYDRHGLTLGPVQLREIFEMTSGSNGMGQSHMDVYRDSIGAIRTWRTRLSQEEILRIRCGTEDISPAFYGDCDW